MGNPFGSFHLSEVLVVLLTDVGHLLLKNTELVLEVLKLRNNYGLLSVVRATLP